VRTAFDHETFGLARVTGDHHVAFSERTPAARGRDPLTWPQGGHHRHPVNLYPQEKGAQPPREHRKNANAPESLA